MNQLRHYGRHDELLEVTCWCERCVDLVPAYMVRSGRTWSCGRDCHEGCPERERAA